MALNVVLGAELAACAADMTEAKTRAVSNRMAFFMCLEYRAPRLSPRQNLLSQAGSVAGIRSDSRRASCFLKASCVDGDIMLTASS